MQARVGGKEDGEGSSSLRAPPYPSGEANSSDLPHRCPLHETALINLLLIDPLVGRVPMGTVGNSRCQRDSMVAANAFGTP